MTTEELYGTPQKRADEMISDTLWYVYEGDNSHIEAVKSSVLSDVEEILRNCIDHKEDEKHEYYTKVKEIITNYK